MSERLEIVLLSILEDAIKTFQKSSVLQKKSVRVSQYLQDLESAVPHLRDLKEKRVEEFQFERILHRLLESSRSIQGRGGRAGELLAFINSRTELYHIDDNFQDLLMAVEPGLRIQSKFMSIEDLLRKVTQKQNRDNIEDLESDWFLLKQCLNEARTEGALYLSAIKVEEELGGLSSRQADERLRSVESARNSIQLLASRIIQVMDQQHSTIDPNELDIYADRQVGLGEFGPIYEGKWRGMDVLILTILAGRKSLQEHDSMRQKIFLLEKLDCSNLCKIYGTCAFRDGSLAVVMEKYDMTLLDFIESKSAKGGIKFDEVVRVVKALVTAVCFLHDKNLLHRNIRPSNIWLSTDLEHVKLSGFSFDNEEPSNVRLAYTAPECLADYSEWTFRGDVFAFAMTCWELIYGERIHRMGGSPRFQTAENIPSSLVSTLQRCIERDVKKRPFIQEVAEILYGEKQEERQPTHKSGTSGVVQNMVSLFRQGRSSLRRSRSLLSSLSQKKNQGSTSESSMLPKKAIPAKGGVGIDAPVVRRINATLERSSSSPAALWNEGEKEHIEQPSFVFHQRESIERAPTPSLRSFSSHSSASSSSLTKSSTRKEPPRLPARPVLKQVLNLLDSVQDDSGKIDTLELVAALEKIANALCRNGLTDASFKLTSCLQMLALIQSQTAEPEVQRWGLVVIRVLAMSNEGNRQILAEFGMHLHVLSMMRLHRTSPHVQANGCVALYSFLIQDGVSNREAQMFFLSSGACGDVLSAMKSHRNDEQVQIKACWALIGLSNNNQALKSELVRADGPDQVLKALQALQSEKRVQENGLAALWNLIDNNIASQKSVISSHGPSVVVRSMKSFPDEIAIQENGLGCLRCLISGMSQPNRHQLLRKTSLTYLLKDLLSQHKENANLNILAFDLAAQLAAGDVEVQQHLGSIGLYAIAEEQQVAHSQNTSVLSSIDCFLNVMLGDNSL